MGQTERSTNGLVESEFLLKYDGHLYPTKVLIPHAIDSKDPMILIFMQHSFQSLVDARNKLSVLPSRKGAHGRPRSKREYGDISKQQQDEKNKINHALSIFYGNTSGVIEIIPALNKDNGKLEPVGFKAISTKEIKP